MATLPPAPVPIPCDAVVVVVDESPQLVVSDNYYEPVDFANADANVYDEVLVSGTVFY